MNAWLVTNPLAMMLLTALVSAALTLIGVFVAYQWRIKPRIDARVAEVQLQVAGLEARVAAGVRQGIGDALKDMSDKAVRSTTRSVVKMGSDLVEGGLSSFLNDKGRRRHDPSRD